MPLTDLAASRALTEQAANSSPQLLDTSLVFTSTTSLVGGRLVVSGLLAEDRISILSLGIGPGQINVAAGVVSYGSVDFGTIQGGQGASFTVQFGAAVTAEAVDALLERLAYANVSDQPTITRTLTIDVRDAAGAGLAAIGPLTPLTGSASPFSGFDLGNNATPAFVDIDGDGDRDLVSGDNSGLFFTWRNTGTAAAPAYTALTGAANPFNGLDAGTYSAPAFVDLDGDGDLDLVSGQGAGGLAAWRNTGTSAVPAFTALTDAANPFNGVTVGRGSAPAFLDLDGDGDFDLVSGNRYGTLSAWRNTGTTAAPAFTALTGSASPFNGIDLDLNSAPALLDWDGDGDLDLVSGENTGLVQAWRNTGTNAAPVFTALTGAANPFNGLDAGSYSKPAFADLDGDGDLDLVAGIVDGTFVSWLNSGQNVTPTITITVARENDAPSVTSAATASFAENGTGTAYQAAGSDPEGTTLSWTLGGADAALFNISATGAVTFKAAPNFEAPADAGGNNVYDLTVTATDGALSSAARAVAITVTNVNEAPSVTSVATASFAENGTGTAYQATGSDPDSGTTITWALGGTDAALFNIGATGAVTFKAAPNFEAPADAGGNNVYDLTVTASDGALSSAARAVAITVTNVNEAPSVTSAATASFAENGTGTAYQATGSDPDTGTTLSWALGGADAAMFNINAMSGAVTFKAAPNFEAPGDAGGNNVYDLTVTASDGALSSAARAVAISVTNVNEAPSVTSAATASFAENGTGTAYQAAGSDPEGTTLSWTLGGADAALFNISATGTVTFKAAPNFEAPADAGGNNVYDITVTASDGALSSAARAVAITVTNVNEAPSVTSAATASFAENGTGTAYQATGSDPDTGTTLSWALGGADAALFNISATGAVTFKAAPNFEAPADVGGNNVYDLTVTASDGALSSAARAVAITVTNVNEAPSVTSAATASFAENGTGTAYQAAGSDAEGATLSWILGGTDAALFDINAASGAVTFKSTPEFEAPADAGGNNVYDITVTASDGALNSAARAVAITVTNVNEAPSVTSAVTGSFVENGAGLAYQAEGSDPDAGTTLSWTLGGTDAELFNINEASGAVTFKSTPNFEAPADAGGDNVYDITVTASDGALSSAAHAVAITVTNANEAPSVTSVATADFAENGTGVAYQAAGSDPDAGTTLSWILGGTDAALFDINAVTGAVSFKVAPNFEAPADAGGNNVYDITVTASDDTLSSAARAVAITVTDVNDAPSVNSAATASFAENGTGVAYQATGSALDAGATLSWILGGMDALLFDIDAASGTVSFKAAPDFEAPADAGGDNVYDITVIASDGTVSSAARAVAITVTNVNEAPIVTYDATFSAAEMTLGSGYPEFMTLRPMGSDPDAGTILTWTLGGTDMSLFRINATTGAVDFAFSPDFEAPADADGDNAYDITVTASDGALSSAARAITIIVTNVNEPLAVTSGGTANFAENAAGIAYQATATVETGTTLSWALGGADAALFDISATTGAVSFKTAPDFEAPADAGGNNVYDITVTASDGVRGIAARSVAMTVTNVNEAPIVTYDATVSAAEMTLGSGYPEFMTLRPIGSDPDAGTILTWTLGGTDMSLFRINATTGAVDFAFSPDFEAPADANGDNVYDITVTASDGVLSSVARSVAVMITNVNEAPSITSGFTVNLAENDTGVAYQAVGSDPDAATTLTWSLGGADAALFAINSSGGVTFRAVPNFEAPADLGRDNVHYITVTVSDGTLSSVAGVAITVTNVNEAPSVTSGGTTSFAENGAGVAYLAAGSDPDAGATLSWALGGTDAALFSISATGAVTFKTAPDFEAPADAGGNNVYDITVTASDGMLSSAARAVAITVTDISGVTRTGTAQNDTLQGGIENDTLIGLAGDDLLNGGIGADRMEGGAGDDTYLVDQAGDVLVERRAQGTDKVLSSVNWTLGAEIEHLQLVGVGDLTGTGNILANRIEGNDGANALVGDAGNDTLEGGLGADTMEGGTGDDVYGVDDAGDRAVELAGGGKDRINAALSWTLGAEIEELTLTGSADLNGNGNLLANLITGNAGANILNGGAGNDTLLGGAGHDVLDGNAGTDRLVGGLGDDTYVVDDVRDATEEQTGGGTDSVQASVSWSLGSEVENLYLVGAGKLSGTGNLLANRINGNAEANLLDGGAGNDTLVGGAGDDTLEGGAGADSMEGGAGDDTYYVNLLPIAATPRPPILGGGTNPGTPGDVVVELSGGGRDHIISTISWALGAEIENLTLTGSANMTGTGNSLANTLTGGSGQDTLSGEDGNDTLDGGSGRDRLVGGAGNDTYFVDSADDALIEAAGGGTDRVNASLNWTLGAEIEQLFLQGAANLTGRGNDLANLIQGNAGANALDGGLGNDTLLGGDGNDTLDGTADQAPIRDQPGFQNRGADRMEGGAGDDTYTVDSLDDVVVELPGGGTDRVLASVSWTLGAAVERLTLTGGLNLNGTGNELANEIIGNGGANELAGGAGDDTLRGGAGNDTLVGGVGADSMEGGAGDDTFRVDAPDDKTIEAFGGGTDSVIATLNWTLGAEIERLTLVGAAALIGLGNSLDNRIDGNDGANQLLGAAGNDTLVGGAGRDLLDGGAGADRMEGGADDDTYEVNATNDVVVEVVGGGWDRVNAGASWTMGAEVEQLKLTGTSNLNGTGNDLANWIEGNGGANSLNGGAGADTLIGGAGNDTLEGGAGADSLEGGAGDDVYGVDQLDDLVVELANGGTDRVNAAVNWTLGAEIENLTLTGTTDLSGTGNSLANTVTGNGGANALNGAAGNDTLIGGDGNDTLNGGTGADRLEGGAGDDTYEADSADVVTIELADAGIDTVRASLKWVLAAQIERLVLTGTENLSGIGNTLNNRIEGNAGNNLLMGDSGVDTLIGGAGNDTLDGGTGARGDRLEGGLGDDTYEVNDFRDVVIELVGEGWDRVNASASYTLRAEVEELVLTGTADLSGWGNDLANRIDGNTGANSLTGGAGNDTLRGGAGNDSLEGGLGADRLEGGAGDDVYGVDQLDDLVVELANGGTDRVNATLDWTLGTDFENLTLLDTANLNGTGNALANVIIGNAGANQLNGDAGNDTLIGGAGNDTLVGGTGADRMQGGDGDDVYRIEDASDTVTESANGGNDRVEVAVSWSLGAQIEQLLLTGTSDLTGTGNELANSIEGNSGANMLSGGMGDDTLLGLLGQDTLRGDTGSDSLDGGSGDDSLEGGAGDDSLIGGVGRDTLDGGTGNDRMEGGADDDTYLVDAAADVVVEAGGGGRDTVNASVSWIMTAEVEQLRLTGTANLDGTGNDQANQIDGNAGANSLKGGAGADTLIGGAGNDTLDGGIGADRLEGGDGDDTYVVDSVYDAVVELRSGTFGGKDRVNVTSERPLDGNDWTLSSDIEDLYLLAAGNLSATGNREANRIEGNSAANRLTGLDGNDTLIGGAGNDTLDGGAGTDSMVGGAGNDLYIVSRSTAIVVEAADGGNDRVEAAVSWVLGEEIEDLALTGLASAGTGNAANNLIVGNASGNHLAGLAGDDTLEGRDGDNWLDGGAGDDYMYAGFGNDLLDGGSGADFMAGGAGNDRYYVDSPSDVVYETTELGTDLVYSFIEWTMVSGVEDLLLLYTSDIAGTGNELANKIKGNFGSNRLFGLDGDDSLDGDKGNDYLDGGDGNDTLRGGNDTDSLRGGAGADVFEFTSSFSANGDVIEDFSAAQGDRIDVRAIDTKARTALDDAFSWISGASFSKVAGQLRFSDGILAGDLNGDGAADFQITLTGVTSLSASSIWL